MTSRFEKERAKQIQDKCQDLLTQMLRDEDNKYCVDCDAKGPRWASWNLGIFLCIRCAGIHRNLGVHISKVRSVNLDTWTPEQVVSLQQMGNSRARAVYEANLPDSFRRPQTDCSLESFIRAKYEHKKYIAREWVPPPLPKVNWDKELDEEAERQRRRKKEGSTKSSTSQNSLPPVKKPEVVPQIPKPRSSVSPKPTRANNSATLDLLGLDAPVNQANANGSTSGDDIFSSFLSATPASASPAPTSATNGSAADAASAASKTDEENFFNQPAPTPQEKSKMTKDSILALYGTPSHQTSPFGVPGGGIYAQQPPVQQFAQQPPVQQFAQQPPVQQFAQQPPVQQFAQPVQNISAFGQQNSFPTQPSAMAHLGQLQGQIGMPVANQVNLAQNQMNLASSQIGLNASQMGHVVNPIGSSLHMGPVGQINGLANNAMAIQSQMMMQMPGQNNISSNNGWSGMIAAQNLQPAPGSNPFFNLPAQPQLNTPFATQLPQQMSQMSLGGLGKPTSAALPGQTLSTNLWQ